MKYKAIVSVMPLREILDPQGKAVQQAVRQLGISPIMDVRIGKQIELQIEAADLISAQKAAEEASAKILANPIIEEFRIVVLEVE